MVFSGRQSTADSGHSIGNSSTSFPLYLVFVQYIIETTILLHKIVCGCFGLSRLRDDYHQLQLGITDTELLES
jgi:hypothetical protein